MLLRKLLHGAIAPVMGIAALTWAAGVSAASLTIPPGETNHIEYPVALAAASSGPQTYLIQLKAAPASVVYRRVTAGVANPDAATLNLARQQTRARVAQIETSQQQVLSRLPAAAPGANVLYRTSKVLNGIVIEADKDALDALRKLPGVKAVLPVEPEYPSTSTSVPYVEAQNVWDAAGFGATGQGVSIGIIDSGIDYQHPDLGGTGALAEYQANDRTVITEIDAAAFPTARVVGGIDLVGDNYPNDPAVPDPDPMDCGGHGTHVATIAAGGGVNADGTAYAGPWDATTNFGALRIGPGTAPQADLYAIRVFGCGGSTAFAAAGIEWAMDPNDDNDLSDHLDVVNMSLGSSFGGLNNATAIAADNASDAGMVMVISAGNSGDTFGITGSPSVSTRAISVANIADSGDVGTALGVNAPAAIVGQYIAANSQISPAVQPAPSGQTNDLVLVDGNNVGAVPIPTAQPFEGCGTALDNAAAVAGKFAFVRRGTCAFSMKVENAQNAGALGVVLYDNAIGEPAPIVMGGTYTALFTPTIPIISTNNATGVAIHNAITNGDTVNVSLLAADAGGTIAFSSSRGPRYEDLAPKPDVSAPGSSITAAQTGITCLPGGGCIVSDADGVIEGGQTLTIGGTSMAAPHVAGLAALMRQLQPTRSVEEIKASLMNGALDDVHLGAGSTGGRISTSRAGSGQVNGLNSASLQIAAFNADNSGAVSVGFDPEIIGSAVQTRSLRFVNHGNTALALGLAFDVLKDSPGVQFSVASTVNIPANSSVVVPVQLNAEATLMAHPRDPTTAPTQTPSALGLAAQGRHWISEESALLVVSDGGNPIARVPVYVAPRATSQMQAPSVVDTAGAATGSAPLALTGTGLCSGTLVGAVCTGTDGEDAVSIYSGFELQALSPRNPGELARNDIRYVGVTTQPSGASVRHIFAIGTYGVSQTAYAGTFQVEIDINGDGSPESTLFNGDTGTIASRVFGAQANGQDVNFLVRLNNTTSTVAFVGQTELFDPRVLDMRLYGNDVVFLHANRATLLLAADTTAFRYRVTSCFAGFPLCSLVLPAAITDQTGWIPWNPAAPGITIAPFLNDDQPGQVPTLNWNTANLATNGSLGALLLHHHNATGRTQQVITLANTDIDVANDAADVSVGLSVDTPTPTLGQNITYTLTAQHAGPNSPVDIAAVFVLPDGLTYVSDTSGGAYDPNTGAWTIPAAVAAAVASIDVTATVETSGPIDAALDAMGNFVDADLSNNHAEVGISGASTADIGVTIAASASPISAGSSVTYTVTLTNAGPDTAFSADVVHDLAGLGLLPTASTPSAGSYDSGTRTWTVGSVAAGQSETLQLTYTLTLAGTFAHSVTATHDDNDPTVPNTDSEDVVVNAGPVATLTVSAGNAQTALVNATFATDLAVLAVDQFTNPVAGAAVTFTPPAIGASGSFAAPMPVSTNASGIATAPDFTANATAGSYFVTASSGSASVDVALENLRRSTSVTLAAVPSAPDVGASVTLTATVLDDLAAPLTAGMVDFSVGGTPLCTGVALSGTGTAECVTSFATAGNVTVRADFVQTASYAASFDDEVVSVGRLTPTVAVSVLPTPVLLGGTVTLTATLSGTGATPTGTVSFVLDGTTVCAAVPVVAGSAQCATTASATVGDYSVVVNYGGDAVYLAGSGNGQVQVRDVRIFYSGFEN